MTQPKKKEKQIPSDDWANAVCYILAQNAFSRWDYEISIVRSYCKKSLNLRAVVRRV